MHPRTRSLTPGRFRHGGALPSLATLHRHSDANLNPTGATATSTATPTTSSLHTSPSLQIESSLYFANADAIRARIQHAAQANSITAVVLDAETIPFIDVTAARMLAGLAKDLRRREVRLLLAHDIG
jgi:anti-anti-sigma factor